MNNALFSTAVLLTGLAASTMLVEAAPEPMPAVTLESASAEPALHCQVPCGIYGDRMRVDMLMEDAATIEKAMGQIASLEGSDGGQRNQMVRWVMTKDAHAESIQGTVASYWLAQRVKRPAEGADRAAVDAYHAQLEHMHAITVAAMKCKQTIATEHVAGLRASMREFSADYFSAEDLEHLREHGLGGR